MAVKYLFILFLYYLKIYSGFSAVFVFVMIYVKVLFCDGLLSGQSKAQYVVSCEKCKCLPEYNTLRTGILHSVCTVRGLVFALNYFYVNLFAMGGSYGKLGNPDSASFK